MNNCIINRWIIGFSLFTCGIITYSYLHGIKEIQILKLHLKNRKHEMDDTNDQFRLYNIAYIFAITGISFVAYMNK